MQRPPEHLIIPTTTDSSGKIYIREQFGFFQRIRRYLATVLMLVFIGFPWLSIDGRQAFRIDVDRLAIEWFGFVLLPEDFLLIALLFVIAAFALFYVTKLYGRIWCGYTCPQTIWTLMFVWIERRVEGAASKSRMLDNTPWRGVAGLRKLWLRLLKHTAWGVVALCTSLVFVSYFVPARSLYTDFFLGAASSAVTGWVWFFAICTYLNAGLVREKMCLHMCPYARFQSSMFDKASKLVAYDASRGEARGARKKSEAKPADLGDCVDCKLCVQVCPVGIDIRNGLQYECINCGLCIDACDETMRQFNYPTGLIRYQADVTYSGRKRVSRHAGYGIGIIILITALVFWFQQLSSTAMTISRDRQQLSRLNAEGEVENTFTLRVNNKSFRQRDYTVLVQGLPTAIIKQSTSLKLNALEDREFVFTVALPTCPSRKFNEFYITLHDEQTGEDVKEKTSFYGGDC